MAGYFHITLANPAYWEIFQREWSITYVCAAFNDPWTLPCQKYFMVPFADNANVVDVLIRCILYQTLIKTTGYIILTVTKN